MKYEEIQRIIGDIRYKNWMVELYAHPVQYTIRLSWFDTCSVTGEKMIQHSREWIMLESELSEDFIVQTVFKAIANAEEHEVKERFRYKNKRLFNPHVTVTNLLKVCENDPL